MQEGHQAARGYIYPKNAFSFYFSGQTQDLSQRQGKAGWTKRSILF